MLKIFFRRIFRHSFVKLLSLVGFFWIVVLIYLSMLNSKVFKEANKKYFEVDVQHTNEVMLTQVAQKNSAYIFDNNTDSNDSEMTNEEYYEYDEYYDEEPANIIDDNEDFQSVKFVVIKPTLQNRMNSVPKPTLSPEILTLHRRLNLTNPGHLGAPVQLPEKLDLDIEIMLNKSRDVYKINEFVSTLVPLDRELPDIRTNYCKAMNYSSSLPAASIIMVFHNEALSMIMRSIYAIHNRSPDHLVREIILVNDCSTLGKEYLTFLRMK